MKIEDNRPLGTTIFSKLNEGDCFVYQNEYYLKIDVSGTMDDNAFNLRDNSKYRIDGDEMVTFVNAKLVIYA